MEKKKGCRKRFLEIVERAYNSDVYIILITLVGVWGFVFNEELYALLLVGTILIFGLLFCRDTLPALLPLGIMGFIPIQNHRNPEPFVPFFKIFEPFLDGWALELAQETEVPPFLLGWSVFMIFGVIIAFSLRFLIYRPKLKFGRFFYPTFFVAVAISLGGLFHLSFAEYFSFPALYYVTFLGFGMVLAYFSLEAFLPKEKKDMAVYFAKMMTAVGVMGIIMVGSAYYENHEAIAEDGPERFFQWRNNLSNGLLLTMPFAFYLAIKTKWFIPWVVIGIFQFAALMFSYSRGGMVFGALVFPFLVTLTFFLARGNRLRFLFALALSGAALYISIETWISPVEEVIDSFLNRLDFQDDESRLEMFRLALDRFRDYPLFGTGLAAEVEYYSPGEMSMEWYHSTISQVVGSMGLLGIFAYGFQELIRLFTLFESKNRFNLFVLLSFLGFAGYSLVNVGYFVPLPSVATLLFMFMVAERHNRLLEKEPSLYEEEKIPLKILHDE